MRITKIVLALASFWSLTAAFGSTRNSDKDKVLLSHVKTLTLRNNKATTARRVSAIPQLKCVGGNAKGLYDLDVMRCKNSGSDYNANDIQWTCQASLPPEFKLGSTEVMCEGYSSSEDPYILKGSCGVEYRLVLTPVGEEKYGHRSESAFGNMMPRKSAIEGLIFWIFFTFIVGVIAYGAYQAFTGGNRQGPRPWGGNWGGWGGGDDDGNDPPPPYTPQATPKSYRSQQPGQQGWRPGFWTGTAAGVAGAYALGNRYRTEPQVRREPWANVNVNAAPSRSGGWGSGGSSSSAATPSSSRYESTGFGGTSRR